MADKIKCPYCNELNENDHKFCVYCGEKLPIEDVSNCEEQEFINCPSCDTLNHHENIECENCGYLLKEDIKNSFTSNEAKYKRCPECGNIILSNEDFCIICGFDFSDLEIDDDSDFFNEN